MTYFPHTILVMAQQLPEITLTCRNGHQFTTRARAGTTVRCKTCQAPKHVPAGRPRTEREATAAATREATADDDDQAAELAAPWEREPEWDGRQIPDWPGRPADCCTECGGPLTWEPGRTWTHCDACPEGVSLPAAVTAHYERQEQRAELATRASAEVATRTDPTAELAARVHLRTQKQAAEDDVRDVIEAFDPDGLQEPTARAARGMQRALAAYLPEIRNADDLTALMIVEQAIERLGQQATDSGLIEQIERQRDALERAQQRAQQQAEYVRQQQELAAQAERDRREAERQRPKAITAGITLPVVPTTYAGAVTQGLAYLLARQEQGKRHRERKLAEHGPCGYTQDHSKPEIPTRQYWITILDWQGRETGSAMLPQVVACKKHYGMADRWIEEQAALLKGQGHTNIKAIYTELT